MSSVSSTRSAPRKPVTAQAVEKLVRSKVAKYRGSNDYDYFAAMAADGIRGDKNSRKLLGDSGFDVRNVSEKRVDHLLKEVRAQLIRAWLKVP